MDMSISDHRHLSEPCKKCGERFYFSNYTDNYKYYKDFECIYCLGYKNKYEKEYTKTI